MGSGRFTDEDWTSYATSNVSGKSVHEIYSNTRAVDTGDARTTFNPKGIVRESRDSTDNPHSTAIIVALDVTGSMSPVLEVMARQGLPTLMREIYARKPVRDPQVMCMAVGDMECDISPLQVTQFESDIRIAEQLTSLYLEMGGGGNSYESYAAAWYFAATHTSIDCFEKRGKKGYLFTIGDEQPTPLLYKRHLEHFLGDTVEADLSADEILTMASRQWEIFHLIVDEGSHALYHPVQVDETWKKLLGQRVIHLTDKSKLAEVIVSTLQVAEGALSADEVAKTWDGSTSLVVKKAVGHLVPGLSKIPEGVVSL
jgi:hypothetical protein